MTTVTQAGNPASAFATTIGRYFTVVSVVPSLLFLAFLVVLIRSGAWSREPDFGAGVRALAELGLGGTFALILGAVALGAVLHPLQFPLVQFLEGYWGISPFWTALRDNRIRFHLRRREILRGYKKESRAVRDPKDVREPVVRRSHAIAAERLDSIYPGSVGDFMPTRLGNVLRAAEKTAGATINLDVIKFAPHLMMVAPTTHADYVNDQRTSFDLAIRTCLVCMLGFLAAVLYLWPHRLWLLVALGPLGLAWLCYRGAVAAAMEYGAALRMLLDLNRFTLYERMGLPFPATTDAERVVVKAMEGLSIDRDVSLFVRYRQPPDPPAAT